MAGEGTGSPPRGLPFTPTWAIATVSTVLVSISLLVAFVINKVETKLHEHNRKPLVRVVEMLKEELMIMGFITLMITVFQDLNSGFCVKSTVLDHWTICGIREPEAHSPSPGRRLLEALRIGDRRRDSLFRGRALEENINECKPGYEPFVSKTSLDQINTLIFVLAVVHVVYSFTSVALGLWKVNMWKPWEDEVHAQLPGSSDSAMVEVEARETTDTSAFVSYHSSKKWSMNQFAVWVLCFFRQFRFGKSVGRADYLALRLGFVEYQKTGKEFHFHNYLVRSLDDDLEKVMGISAWLWLFVMVFMTLNTEATNLYFWMSLGPAVLALIVGTKLEHIIATLALETAGIIQGGHMAGTAPKPRDDLFWFNKPELVLWIIHLVFFQNAFEMATFIWLWWRFGIDSCMLESKVLLAIRIPLGVLVQILCSFSTLPLYVLVTQMGTHHTGAILHQRVKDKVNSWHKDAKHRVQKGNRIRPISEFDHSKFSDDNSSTHNSSSSSTLGHGSSVSPPSSRNHVSDDFTNTPNLSNSPYKSSRFLEMQRELSGKRKEMELVAPEQSQQSMSPRNESISPHQNDKRGAEDDNLPPETRQSPRKPPPTPRISPPTPPISPPTLRISPPTPRIPPPTPRIPPPTPRIASPTPRTPPARTPPGVPPFSPEIYQ